MRKLYFILITIITAASCTFKQEVKFNKDWSGEISCAMDMSMMASLAGDSVEMPSALDDTNYVKKLDKLKKVPGISNVKVEDNGAGISTVSYSFTDLKALNKSGNMLFSDDETHKDFVYFQVKKKNSLFFTLPKIPADPNAEAGEDNALGEGFEYHLTLSFPKKVKSLETKNGAILSDDKKQVILKTNLMAMTGKDYNPDMLIKFEK